VKRINTFTAIMVLLVAGVLGGATFGQVIPGMGSKSASAAMLEVQQQAPLSPVGNGFTYQGKLNSGGAPATGQYDFTFTLFDSLSGGLQVGSPVALTNQAVSNGIFTVVLNFPATAFRGEARWLQIAVRPANSGNYVTLTPRQALTAAPYAMSAPWDGLYNKPVGFNPARPVHNRTVLDNTSADVGEYPSIAIGVDGLPLISYWDKASGDLKVIHCETLNCSQDSTFVVDSLGNVGKYSSLAIGSDGLGLIAYLNLDNATIRVAHCTNIECSTSTTSIATLVSTADWLSLNIGPNGLGYISYYDPATQDLMLAICNNVPCSSAATQTVMAGGQGVMYGKVNALTFLGDGHAFIAQRGEISGVGGEFYMNECTNAQCSAQTTWIIDSDPPTDISLAVGPDGVLWSAYVKNNGLYLRRFIEDGTGNNLDTPIATNVKYPSIAVLPSGLPIISFYDATSGDLKVVTFHRITVPTAAPWTLDIEYVAISLDTLNNTGLYSSMTIGADGNPIIAYHEESGGDLKVIHCSHPSCIQYSRGR
jgi:hypothetical protein